MSEPNALNLPPKRLLYCSFCGKSQNDVKELIAGPTVFICDECIELCTEIEIQLLPGFLTALENGIPDCSIRLLSISERSDRHSVQVQVQAPRELYPENLYGLDLLASRPLTREAFDEYLAARRVEWDRRYDALAAAGYERPAFVSADVLTQDLHDLCKKLDQALRDELGKGSHGERFAKGFADLKAQFAALLIPHVKAHAVPPPPPRGQTET